MSNRKDSIDWNIRNCIERRLNVKQNNFVIFPYGDVGVKVKTLLNNVYGIQEKLVIDNHLCKYNSEIKPISALKEMDCKDFCVILATTNSAIYPKLKASLQVYINSSQIEELDIMHNKLSGQIERFEAITVEGEVVETVVGKYSYGPLIPNDYCALIESIGSFSSFAVGAAVVPNHPMNYITTHPIMYAGSPNLQTPHVVEYESQGGRQHFYGIKPRGYVNKRTRSRIGNDVWLGRNVIVCNGSNIGNGVVAAAGAVITKDVPDYAVVAGVPAKIIRYRFSPDQIASLNRIAWWNWSNDEIRERYDDFYLPVDEFIKKYDKVNKASYSQEN